MSRTVNIIRNIVVLMAVFMLSVDVVAQDSFFREPVARRDTASPRRPRVGVVLCGGGAKGFAHIRILKKIEEAGIPIDYIGGTSIGSIIGGLYAVGYDPDMMEKLVVNQDWNTIIYDKIPRSIKPIEQKMEQTNYIVTLPITKGKVKVSESLVDGVYVNLLLSRLMLPSKGIDDFTQLPVPFFCIGTDVEGSCEYEMSKGCLSRAIRASMAIPVFFTPVKYDGRLLIDGGMVNNFPVRNMQEEGVDIIIGIDLEDYNISAENIDNSLALFTNMMNLSSHEQTEYGRHNCDIYIRPDLHGLNMMSFSSYDSILSYGEKAAIDIFPKLKRLGDSIRAIEEFTVERPHVKPIDSLYVVDIEVRGLKDNDDPYLKREFGKVFPRLMSVDEIEAAVLRLKASGFYRDLWYEVEDAAGGVIFILHCKETSNQSLSFDIHYDNNYGIGTLVNYKLMSRGNMFKRGSLSIDLNVAERPYVRVRVNKRDGRFFRYGTEFFANYLIIDQYDNNKLTHSYSTQNDRLEFFGQFTTSHVQSFKFGVAGEFFHMRDQIGDVTLSKDYEFYTYFYTRYYLNTEDLTAFARRGWLVDILAKFILYEGVYTAGDKQPAVSLQVDVLKTLPLARRHSLKLGGQLGAKLSKSKLPIPYQYFIGGQSRMKYFDNMIPFYGMSFIDDVVNFITFGKIAWQWNFYRELYSIVSCNAGHMNRDYKDWFNTNSFVAGVGLTLGINTFAGPIEVTLSGSNLKNNLVGFVNVGYWF